MLSFYFIHLHSFTLDLLYVCLVYLCSGFYPALCLPPGYVVPEAPLSGIDRPVPAHGESACPPEPWSDLGCHTANPLGTAGVRTTASRTTHWGSTLFRGMNKSSSSLIEFLQKHTPLISFSWTMDINTTQHGKSDDSFPAHFDRHHLKEEGYHSSHSLHEATPPRHRFPLDSYYFVPQPKEKVENFRS